MRFELATATRIMFGPGVLAEALTAIASLGRKALIVGRRSPEAADDLRTRLSQRGVESVCLRATREPTVDDVSEGVRVARDARCDLVVAIGGGSAIDAGKAIAALAANPGDPLDYLEAVGRGRPLERAPIPFVAIPTTAGTGAEVTRNAVLGVPSASLKVSLRSLMMLPRLAVVDPELTLGLPADVTASTGLDALAQLIEPYVSIRANPVTDALCLDGMRRVAKSLPRACHSGSDLDARTEMALASLYGGLALANAGLGAVHGLAGPIGGLAGAPHGAVCAALLPHAFAVNLEALRRRDPTGHALGRFHEAARALTGVADADASDGAAWLAALNSRLAVRPLSAFGVSISDVDALVERAARSSSMKGNPVRLELVELAEILHRAL